jgi:hypothetical protein
MHAILRFLNTTSGTYREKITSIISGARPGFPTFNRRDPRPISLSKCRGTEKKLRRDAKNTKSHLIRTKCSGKTGKSTWDTARKKIGTIAA